MVSRGRLPGNGPPCKAGESQQLALRLGSTSKPLSVHSVTRLYLPLLIYEVEMIPLRTGMSYRDIVGTKTKTHNNRKDLWETNTTNNTPYFVACSY